MAAAVLALSGCSAPQRPDAGKEQVAPPGRTSGVAIDTSGGVVLGKTPGQPPEEFAGVQHRLPKGAALRNVPALYEQVALTGCAAKADGWRAEGTADNADPEALTFAVVVFFTDPQARIVDSATTTVAVAPGGSGTWTAEREFEAPAGTRCVVRAVHQAK
ncbi:hypothetical protein [Nocardioides humi]|uniref:hypothetical protein n=1 Tax=Nocardioides humi TaxID=449461 RepID=UPI0015E865EB|nr:hypothetical protein [Nocardioides humi]